MIVPVPAVGMRLAEIVAVIEVEESDVTVTPSEVPFQRTTEFVVKLDPVNVRVRSAPARIVVGVTEARMGPGFCTTTAAATVVPPPGVGVVTETAWFPVDPTIVGVRAP